MTEYLSFWLGIPIAFFTAWICTASSIQSRLPALRDRIIVLLIAHPDDEAMFFAPTVLGLTRQELGNHVKILCLSSGNAENIGAIRKKEIVTSARILGLRSDSDVHVIEDPSFPDSMSEHWDSLKIAQLLDALFVKTRDSRQHKNVQEGANGGKPDPVEIDVLITFDKVGISGHPNHQSLYTGAVRWVQGLSKGRESPIALYRLRSTNMIRKYLGLIDMPFTLLSAVLKTFSGFEKKGEKDVPERLTFLNDFPNYRKSQQAMTEAHKSQMVWFRWGWIILSRYMVINDLIKEGMNLS